MEIHVKSLQAMAQIKPTKKYALLSIADSTNGKLISEIMADLVNDDQLHVATLYQEFDDIIEPYHTMTLFTKEQGQDILDFMTGLQKAEVEELYIHCHAGVSRSAAVAAVLELVQENEGASAEYWQSALYAPNSFVYKTLMELLGKYDEEELTRLVTKSVRASEYWAELHTDGEYF